MKRIVGLACAMATLIYAGASEEPVSPESVVIVMERAAFCDGVATNSAISIQNRQVIEKVEAFFPGYRRVPSSDLGSGWELGYTVYFNFPKAITLRVSVSENGGGDKWSMVGGDLATRGDFKAFVQALQKEKPR